MHNVQKLCKKSAKNEVFGHFLDFGDSDRLDIAYDGSAKRFSTCGHGYWSCIINYVCIISINYPKNEVLGQQEQQEQQEQQQEQE